MNTIIIKVDNVDKVMHAKLNLSNPWCLRQLPFNNDKRFISHPSPPPLYDLENYRIKFYHTMHVHFTM